MNPLYERPKTNAMDGGFNFIGIWSLYFREVKRFSKIYIQTFFAPVLTALLFLAIFNIAFEGQGRSAANIPFSQFLVPGLTLMALMTSCFANASFSIMFEKLVQTIVDTLMPPLTPIELTLGYILASVSRGLLVAVFVGCTMFIFVPITIYSWTYIIIHSLGAALFMSLLGLITGIWAEKVDHVASINNFIVLPLTFLSGTFFSIQHLPPLFQKIALYNPVFYLIDGFRYGFFGHSDGSIFVGIIVIITLDIALCFVCVYLIHIGYKLKS